MLCLQFSAGNETPKKHTLINKYGASREIERGGLEGSREKEIDSETIRDRQRVRMKGEKVEGDANCAKGVLLPVESSCSPTSKDSLSVCDLDVFKQARYCG